MSGCCAAIDTDTDSDSLSSINQKTAFQQNAANLLVAPQQIVRPLDAQGCLQMQAATRSQIALWTAVAVSSGNCPTTFGGAGAGLITNKARSQIALLPSSNADLDALARRFAHQPKSRIHAIIPLAWRHPEAYLICRIDRIEVESVGMVRVI